MAFRNDQYLWWQVAELTFDSYLVRNRTRVEHASDRLRDRCIASRARALGRAEHSTTYRFGGSPKSSGGGRSGCWMSIWILDGSTPVPRASQ